MCKYKPMDDPFNKAKALRAANDALTVENEELLDIGCRMAQELREFADDALESGSGSSVIGVIALLEDWEKIHARMAGKEIEEIDDLGPPLYAPVQGPEEV